MKILQNFKNSKGITLVALVVTIVVLLILAGVSLNLVLGENGLTVTQTYYNIPINSTNYGDAASVLSSSNFFWVASRFVYAYSAYAQFGLRFASTNLDGVNMYSSNINSNYYSNRLRPVVSLSSDLLDGTKDASGAWNLKTSE